jgi:arsenite methyltransferase
MQKPSQTLENVKEYYGKVLASNRDLKTTACCSTESLPEHIRNIAMQIHPEVRDRFYGCGAPFPPELEGCTVLDLGCGSGRDTYLLSKLVGQSGKVIGIDMTDEQLAVARAHVDYHADAFGYRSSNVQFVKGYIEDLESAGIANDSIDLIVSNCVVNLSPDKGRVFKEVFRVLKPGGELYFSDVFASRRVPETLAQDPTLLGECLGGALYIEDFRRHLLKVGVPDYRVVNRSSIQLTNPDVVQKIGMIDFSSITIRAFKLSQIEDKCEDYGQVAYYLGTIPNMPHAFMLDDHHLLKTGMPMLVCSNTAAMLGETRYAPHFKILGDLSTHYGLFDCAPAPSATAGAAPSGACC